jgi:hypothetical protein
MIQDSIRLVRGFAHGDDRIISTHVKYRTWGAGVHITPQVIVYYGTSRSLRDF